MCASLCGLPWVHPLPLSWGARQEPGGELPGKLQDSARREGSHLNKRISKTKNLSKFTYTPVHGSYCKLAMGKDESYRIR